MSKLLMLEPEHIKIELLRATSSLWDNNTRNFIETKVLIGDPSGKGQRPWAHSRLESTLCKTFIFSNQPGKVRGFLLSPISFFVLNIEALMNREVIVLPRLPSTLKGVSAIKYHYPL